jgi:uncharacterized Zn finger protein
MATLSVMTARSLVDLLDRNKIEQLAGKENFERGQSLHTAGNVRNLKEKNGAVFGTVKEERDYRVEFWVNDGDLDFICNCAAGAKGAFCAHCSAVALMWLEAKPKAKQGRGKTKPRSIMDDIAAYLALEDKKAIVAFLAAHVKKNRDLQQALWIAAAGSGLLKVDANVFRGVIEKTIHRSYSGDETPARQAKRIGPIVSLLQQFCDAGRSAEVLELAEFALHELDQNFYGQSGAEKQIQEIASALLDLHFQACTACRPAPASLAQWLLTWSLTSNLDATDLLEKYKELLGTEGLAAFRACAEAEWEKVMPTKARGYVNYDNHRRRLTAIMRQLAQQSGDVELQVAVEERDLSQPEAFIAIIKLYDQAGEHAKAFQWAKEGLKNHSHEHLRFKSLIADQHWKLGRSKDAMALLWKLWESTWTIDFYEKLRNCATELNQWPLWRTQALNALQATIAKEDRQRRSGGYYWNIHPREHLIRVFLLEEDLEAAWTEVQKSLCHPHLLLQVAVKLEERYPERAVPLYTRVIESAVNAGDRDSLKEAVKLLLKVQALQARLGKTPEFVSTVLTLRKKYYARATFLEMLDKANMPK